MQLTKRYLDLASSMIVLGMTTTVIASSPVEFYNMLVGDALIRMATSVLVNQEVISPNLKEFIDYIAGGLIFGASYEYCNKNISSLIPSVYLSKPIVTGLIPMLSINLNTKLTKMAVPVITSNQTTENADYCIINSLKFTFYQAIKGVCMPIAKTTGILDNMQFPLSNSGYIYTMADNIAYRLHTLGAIFIAYFASGALYSTSFLQYFIYVQANSDRAFQSANNSYVAATIANLTQPYISGHFATYDLLYGGIKKAMDIGFSR